MQVVATAGHVDHGKSTLVRALTGQDPDRLDEERRRGLSIELGYCWTELPGVGDVAFVDVPGHERFIATTLAGVGPVPVAMLVVAADDPWMPQAAEHLRALDALGVEHGVLVVTRSDLADPAPALATARAELSRTTLRHAPHVTVSGRTGQGLDLLRRTLSEVLRNVPPADPRADVRLWVDRRFHVRGAGSVVTGTLTAGTVSVSDTLVHEGRQVRVRGVESLGRPERTVSGVARVALDLGGRAPTDIARGSVLVSADAFESCQVVDVRLTGEARLPERPVLHIGAAMVATRARPLGERFARIALERSLPLRVGDRALLRDPGNRALWGVSVLDPAPPALRRRGAAARRALDLQTLDGSLAADLALRGVARVSWLRRLGLDGTAAPAAVVRGDWAMSPDHAQRLRRQLADEVAAVADGPGGELPVAAAAHLLGLPDPDLLHALVEPPLVVRSGRVSTGSEELPAAARAALDALRQVLDGSPFSAPAADDLPTLGLDRGTVATLHRRGHVLRLADTVVLLPDAVPVALDRLSGLPQPFSTSEARSALGTSRRVVLALLAHLDGSGHTVRLPDDRRRMRHTGPGTG